MALTQNFYNFIKKSVRFSTLAAISGGSSNYVWAGSSDNDLDFVSGNGGHTKNSNHKYFASIFRTVNDSSGLYNFDTPIAQYDTTFANEYTITSNPNIITALVNQKTIFEDNTSIPFLFRFGSSDEKESVDDYNCKNILNVTYSILARETAISPNSFDIKYLLSVINNTDTAITIKEIACFKAIIFCYNSDYTSSSVMPYFCIDRTVLDTPISIEGNGNKVIEYTLHLNN